MRRTRWPAEIEPSRASGAGVVLCPSTEANLGDGLADLPGWLAAGVPLTIGSDSHVGRDWREELRWLEYGQRLVRRQRNVAAARGGRASSAERLFGRAVEGSAAAAASALGPGRRARAPTPWWSMPARAALLGLPHSHRSTRSSSPSPARAWRDVMVAGRWAIRDGVHPRAKRSPAFRGGDACARLSAMAEHRALHRTPRRHPRRRARRLRRVPRRVLPQGRRERGYPEASSTR
jgi:formimidoylglutamate deiminase